MKVPIIVPTVLDTSAFLKLFVDEPRSDVVRAHVEKYGHSFYVTTWTIAEALAVVKRLWLKKSMTREAYWAKAFEILQTPKDAGWQVEDVDLHNENLFIECERLAKKHDLDVVDAAHMAAIRHSMLRFFSGWSKPLLVSADGPLCAAARTEGFHVWNVMDESAPERELIET